MQGHEAHDLSPGPKALKSHPTLFGLQCQKLCVKETRNKTNKKKNTHTIKCASCTNPNGGGPNLFKPHLLAVFIAIGNRDSGNTFALGGKTVLEFTRWKDGRLRSICLQRAELSEFHGGARVFDFILQSELMSCF